jgi:hypothetical protein
MVVSTCLSKRELRELIDTGHRLGVLRFSAVIPRNNLEDAAHKLRKIEYQISTVFADFNSCVDIGVIRRRVNDIKITMFADVNALFDGGARSRLRHSMLYKSLFDSLLHRLEISRHEHYKTYEDVTNNLLSPTLDRVGEVLSYYEIIEADYVSLFQLVSLEVTAEKNTAIKELQVTAELFLFFAVVPYYLGHAFSETTNAFDGFRRERGALYSQGISRLAAQASPKPPGYELA